MEFISAFITFLIVVFIFTYIVLRIIMGSWYSKNRAFFDEGIFSESWEDALKKRMKFEATIFKWALNLSIVITIFLFISGRSCSDKNLEKQNEYQNTSAFHLSNYGETYSSNEKIKKRADLHTDMENIPGSTVDSKEQNNEIEVISDNEEQSIRNTVVSYHDAVAQKRIDEALDFYVSYRRPQIKINKLKQIAEGTEYYVVEEVKPLSFQEENGRAYVYVRVRQKPVHSSQEQVWEGVWIMEKENGEWKIVRTPGRRIK